MSHSYSQGRCPDLRAGGAGPQTQPDLGRSLSVHTRRTSTSIAREHSARTAATETADAEAVSVGLEWLAKHGDRLYAYAIQRVHSAAVAEDLVQETFLGAIRSAEQYVGAAREETWLIGILRHKLVDYYRRRARDVASAAAACVESSDLDDGRTPLSQSRAKLATQAAVDSPLSADDPAATAYRREFQHQLRACIDRLPDRLRAAFNLRVFDDLSTDESANLLGITSANLSARLYRARLALRDCLGDDWF